MISTIDPAVVEFANEAFYLAFNSGNLAAMADLWAADSPVSCIHPGWRPLLDRDEILQSWARIFQNRGEDRQIHCHTLRVMNHGQCYSVICYEQMAGAVLVAMNSFVLESGELKLVHHQGGQCMDPPDLDSAPQTIQ